MPTTTATSQSTLSRHGDHQYAGDYGGAAAYDAGWTGQPGRTVSDIFDTFADLRHPFTYECTPHSAAGIRIVSELFTTLPVHR